MHYEVRRAPQQCFELRNFLYTMGRTDDDLKRGKSHGLHMGAFYVSDPTGNTWDSFK